MPKNTSARGYTNVVLVLNMKRFVRPDDQERFETARGSQQFARALRSAWPETALQQAIFFPEEDEPRYRQRNGTIAPDDLVAAEQIGFATGIFNTRMIEAFTFPDYALEKGKIEFDQDLRTNFQFTKVFERVWNRWDIYIRPTITGFFVIRLTQRYQENARRLLDLAQDVLHLQESLDVVSAQRWLAYNRERYLQEPETLAIKERSVMALLRWMGADETESGGLLYYPVQWKLAMVVAGIFVREVGREIPLPGNDPIQLVEPEPSLSIPLHSTYIIHHFDELLAHPAMLARTKKQNAGRGVQISARVSDLHASPRLRRALVNLLEGTVLQPPRNGDEEPEASTGESHFPEPRWSITDSLVERNVATWNDEFCVFDSRTAIIIPSQQARPYEIAVSTVPSATLRVRYPRYWSAVERMIEFVMEVHIFTELLEGVSFDLLTEIVDTVHKLRSQILNGNIQLDANIAGLVTRAADLRKHAALAQSLGHARMWGEAEYGLQKASKLLEIMGVPDTLMHIERNIESINSVVDQVDEWYLADLSEKSNDRAHYLTILVTAASVLLTLLILPSFWADIWQVTPPSGSPYIALFTTIGIIATAIALVMIVTAGSLLLRTARKKDLRRLIERITEDNSSAPR